MSTPPHAEMIRLLQAKSRRWQRHCEALRARVAKLHPETGGHIGIVHNWGNAAAREAVRQAGERWRAYDDRTAAKIQSLMRAHIAWPK